MTSLRRALIALGLVGFAAGVLSIIVAVSGPSTEDEFFVVGDPLIAWSFIGTGLWAWHRRPENRTGMLMTGVGFAWFLSSLSAAEAEAIYAVGLVFDSLPYALLFHMIVTFPSGRATGLFERALIGVGYFATTALVWPRLLVFDPRANCDCAANPLLLDSRPGVSDALESAQEAVALVALASLIALFVRRWRNAQGRQREALAPVMAAGALAAFAVGAEVVAEIAGASTTTLRIAEAVGLVTVAVVPFAFLTGLLRTRLSREAALGALVERLRLREGSVRDALADALGDPTLSLAYWVPGRNRFVDADGRPVELPGAGSQRAASTVERDGVPVAAIVYDRGAADDSSLVRGAGAAAALALQNERLEAELRSRLDELAESRARLVRAADQERRRLERDLHDGAQQRLVALALDLRLARNRLDDGSPEAELIDQAQEDLAEATDELRELARGLHPAVLSDHGLGAALRTLADRAPFKVQVSGTSAERFPPAVESAAYFVVAEALTNVARYSAASQVRVRARRENGRLLVEVSDDGKGGADPSTGSGLNGLADRIAALDGRFSVESPEGRGTTIRAEIPCE